MQRTHLGIAFGGVLDGVVRMHPGGGEQHAGMGAGQRERLGRVFAAGAGDHHPGDTGRAGAREHGIAVVVEAVVGEVGADVDEGHGVDCTSRSRLPLS